MVVLLRVDDPILFSDAKRAENQIEYVISSRGAGDLIERSEGVIEVQQEHFVGNLRCHGVAGSIECDERVRDQLLMAYVSEKAGFLLDGSFTASVFQDRRP